MCGRFALSVKTEEIEKLKPGFAADEELPARYNIAPMQNIAVSLNDGNSRISIARWGLIPFWAKDESIANKMINARAESLLEKPSFRNSLKTKRCLIFANAFYEWKKNVDSKKKTPFLIKLQNSQPFTFAGLWDKWINPLGDSIITVTIITTEPNMLISSIHNRMPVILGEEARIKWLSKESKTEELVTLLKPFPEKEMTAYEVSTIVNSPAVDFPGCMEPVV
jgi:putative SOS response-associated peptidase YedK